MAESKFSAPPTELPAFVVHPSQPNSLQLLNSQILSDENIDLFRKQFESAEPFPHVVIPNFFTNETVEEILAHFPPNDSPIWFVYNNPIEVKLACNILGKLHPSIVKVIFDLNSPEFIAWVSKVSGIPDLEADPYLHGGGVHSHPRGGKLEMHLDYSIHPYSHKERRLNLILYLNKDWNESYGGAIEFWDAKFTACAKRVQPLFNQAVLFQTSDLSYHGLPDPIKCPTDQSRKSLALYYLSPVRPNATPRLKAQFLARPTDPQSAFLDRLRAIRVERRLTAEDLVGWDDEKKRLESLGLDFTASEHHERSNQ